MRHLLLCAGLLLAAVAPASLVLNEYRVSNGSGQASGGSFNYWDKEYSGTGDTSLDGSYLSGGKGNLTDGVIATDNWFNVENAAGTGPYVGWLNENPFIEFHFASASNIDSIEIYADDSDGAGGVSLPDEVSINGIIFDVDQAAAGTAPKKLSFTGLGLVTDVVSIQVFASNSWVFVSEITFNETVVPEPATMAALGIGAVALIRRRKR